MKLNKLFLVLFVMSLITLNSLNYAEDTEEDLFEEPEDLNLENIPVDDDNDDVNSEGFTSEQLESLEGSSEQFDFNADVSRIMDIIINSLYTNKEVFLRELISNASDALDKIRYKVLKDPSSVDDFKKMEIKIEFNKDEKTLTISDTGIGMTKAELIKNLGTVARSGTTQFLELIGKTQDMNLIGQFGVGFYSSFLVANKVTVISKSDKEADQHIWASTADGKFVINKDPRGNTMKRGTKIILHLKEDAVEYVEQDKIKELVKRYSQFINYPIYLWISKDVTKQVDEEEYFDDDGSFEQDTDEDLEGIDDPDVQDYRDEQDKKKKQEKEDAIKAMEDSDESIEDSSEESDEDVEVTEKSDDDEEEEEEENKKKTITETVWDWELINDTKAIWLRPKNEVESEEYNDFYKGITKDNEDPLTYSHFSAEGDIEFKSILFIPSHSPSDMFENYYGDQGNMKLYVRRVLISDEFDDLMPRYLSFISGVVHSDDLPLNVAREQLQQLKMIKVMSKKIVRKALDMIRKLAEEEGEEYADDDEEYESENEDDTEVEYEDESADEDGSEPDEDEEEEETRFEKFWAAFGKNIKLGVIEDSANRAKLAKLLR